MIAVLVVFSIWIVKILQGLGFWMLSCSPHSLSANVSLHRPFLTGLDLLLTSLTLFLLFLIAYSCLFIIVLFSITLINAIAIKFLCALVRNWRPSDYDIAMPTIP